MIVGISIRNFRAIQSITHIPLQRFNVLVGPNASGKTTFLDAIDFIKDCLKYGPRMAVESRVPDFRDLTWMRQGGAIDLELWLDIGHVLESQQSYLFHYHLSFQADPSLGVGVKEEVLRRFLKSQQIGRDQPFEFQRGNRPKRLLGKTAQNTDFFQREKGTHQDSFVFGMDRLTLASTPPDKERYPTANAIKELLQQGIHYIQLNSIAMRQPCPATRPTEMELDGSNLARVVGRFYKDLEHEQTPATDHEALQRWSQHLRYALPDLKEIGWAKRNNDNAEYLVLRYENGLECPSWLISDGTLRMLALTLPAFLPPKEGGIYMVEEPENGVHPKALEIMIQSLSQIPGVQMLVATHSPFVVQQVGTKPLLCFSLHEEGTNIQPGKQHPILQNWNGIPDLATLFASGVLG